MTGHAHVEAVGTKPSSFAMRGGPGAGVGLCARFLLVCALSATALAESAAGLKWTAPAEWKPERPQAMRAATYSVPAAAGDTAPAECAVYFFGAGQGGPVQANLDRWKGQFTTRDGKPAAAQVATRTSHGLTITTIEAAGSYSGLGGPVPADTHVVQNYRLLGAIVEGRGGNIFVKFTGPDKTVAANRAKFQELLASFQPEK
jgi:hypothetical protein